MNTIISSLMVAALPMYHSPSAPSFIKAPADHERSMILPKVYHSKGDRLWRKRYHSHIHKQMLLRDKYRTPQPECPGLLLSFNDISHLSYQYRVWGVV